MSNSSLFKPSTSSSGIGKKATDKGQFSNPPEYCDVARMTAKDMKDPDGFVGSLEKSPAARKGKV